MSRRTDQRRAVARLGILGLAIAVAFAVVANAGIGPSDAQRAIAGAGLLAPVLFVLAAGVLGLALFPGHLAAATSGLLFGALAGTALALAAALLGAGLCLFAARHLGADALASLLGPRAQRHRAWLTANGFSAVLASRLAPGLPAGPVNYLAGLAGVRPRAFFAAVALGALPKTIAYVALGGALSDPLSTRGAVAAALYVSAAVGGALVARSLVRSRPNARRHLMPQVRFASSAGLSRPRRSRTSSTRGTPHRRWRARQPRSRASRTGRPAVLSQLHPM